MSYDARETSLYAGRPVLLFKFTVNGVVYSYAGGDVSVDYAGHTYSPTEMIMSVPGQATEVQRQQVEIRAPRTLTFAQGFITRPPRGRATINVFRFHRDDAEVRPYWSGRVLGVAWEGSEVIITADPYTQSLKRRILRQQFGPRCQHVIYDALCGVNPATYEATTQITEVSGLQVRAPGFGLEAHGYWLGGYIRRSNGDEAFIAAHDMAPNSDRITLLSPLPGLTVGETVTIAPGCDGTEATCTGRFNNFANILAFFYVPTDNPFSAGVK